VQEWAGDRCFAGKSDEEVRSMAQEKNKPKAGDQETIQPGGKKRQDEELCEKDLDKAAGGAVNAYLQVDGIKGESQD
jgi:hypothetical protein